MGKRKMMKHVISCSAVVVGCFQHQRSVVRIQTSTNFISRIEKTRNEKKKPGMAQFQKHVFNCRAVVVGCFQHQRSVVQIQTSTNLFSCIEKTKKRKKDAGNGPIPKTCHQISLAIHRYILKVIVYIERPYFQ